MAAYMAPSWNEWRSSENFMTHCSHCSLVSPEKHVTLTAFEHLTRRNKRKLAVLQDKTQGFYAEKRADGTLPPNRIYVNSGYDHGKLSTKRFHKNAASHFKAVHCLCNVVPQTTKANRGTLRRVETFENYLLDKFGELLVWTGCEFAETDAQRKYLKDGDMKVEIPVAIFKIIIALEHRPDRVRPVKWMWVFSVPNDDSTEIVPLEQLTVKLGDVERRCGIQLIGDKYKTGFKGRFNHFW